MKAITLQDDSPGNQTPWLSFVEYGIKTIETRRNWKLKNHRGDTLFTASASSNTPNAGLAVCMATIVDIVPMTKAHEEAACINVFENGSALILENLRWLSRKFPVKGALGIFDVELPADVTFYTPPVELLQPKQYPAYLRYWIIKHAPK